MTYVGKAEYMDDWKTKWVFPAIGMIPIDRSGGDASQRALDAAAGVLEAGELFGIYPEGTRARDGKLHKGHTGSRPPRAADRRPDRARWASSAPMPCSRPTPSSPSRSVACTSASAGRSRSSGTRDRAGDRMVLRQITDEVMYEIRNLSGQEYVDSYAGRSAEVETVAPVVPLPERPAPPEVLVASAASSPGLTDVSFEADGVERRSSSAAIRSRPLDLGIDLELTSA